jgi:hypothetical protein
MHHETKGNMSMDQSKPVVQQATMVLSHVVDEVPVLYVADGTL